MCQKGGRTGWVPGSYLMASSSLRSFDQSEVLGFVGSMESPLGDQNGKFMKRLGKDIVKTKAGMNFTSTIWCTYSAVP